jgi:diguanylate cyclase (GGDEF)-like protein
VLQAIMQQIADLFEPQDWSLLIVDHEKSELYFAIAVGVASSKLKDVRLRLGEGIAGWAAERGEMLITDDAYQDPRFAAWVDRKSGFLTMSIVCVPLRSKGRTLGVIELLNVAPDRRDPSHLELLQSLSDFAAIAIENAQHLQRIEQLTIVDDCTGLFNSRHMYAVLDEELRRALRYQLPLALIFLDLDHFKQVNDHHDHLVGSRLLREVGQLFRQGLRDVDTAFRYGGDEFVLVLPNTPKPRALKVAERQRRTLGARRFFHREGLDIQIKASFGVASYPEDAKSKEELVRAADLAMYRVKNSTRNGVCAAGAEPIPSPP